MTHEEASSIIINELYVSPGVKSGSRLYIGIRYYRAIKQFLGEPENWLNRRTKFYIYNDRTVYLSPDKTLQKWLKLQGEV